MQYYIKGLLEEFPYKIKATKNTPWTEKVLKVQEYSKKLDEERRSIFHTNVMKSMYFWKREQPDIDQSIVFLSSIVKDANEGDWNKLFRFMSFLKWTINNILTLEADDTNTLTWCIDVSFSAHADMKICTVVVFTMGKEAIISISIKKKSICEAPHNQSWLVRMKK